MKRTKQTVLFPFGENGLLLHPLANIDQCMKSYKKEVGYFFTSEELNEYTQNVIKQALKTAAEKAEPNILNKRPEYSKFTIVDVDKQSITNTFEETYRLFSVD